MAEDRSLSDVLLDYTVYAPIGLALSIAEELPKLSEKGREVMGGRLQVARVVGMFTVGEARRRAGRMFGDGSRPLAAGAVAAPPSALSETTPGTLGTDKTARASHRTALEASGPVSRAVEDEHITARVVSPASDPGNVDPAPAATSLAIPGYDTLAASQVVQRLSSLRSDELDAIRRYEIATRGRRTILHRIAQLAADR
jgi:hypothetical protein